MGSSETKTNASIIGFNSSMFITISLESRYDKSLRRRPVRGVRNVNQTKSRIVDNR
jgi:hypothetical protein